jgi:predicted metal-dependent peptidase
VKFRFADLIRRPQKEAAGDQRVLQAARLRAAYQRSYFAPALFSLVPVETDLIGSMAVDVHWRVYYNRTWLATHTVEENATLLIHEVGHLLRDHEGRKKAAGIRDHRRWNTAGDCEINDDLAAEGLPLPGDPPLPGKYGLQQGDTAEHYYKQLTASSRTGKGRTSEENEEQCQDCGSGAHGQHRFWELSADDEGEERIPGVDRLKAELVRREVAQRIDEISSYAGDVSPAWRRWARETLAPKVDYLATIRHVVRRALRDSTLGRYDRTYRRPHRRQACYGDLLMPSFYQPRPRPGFLIDTSSSMEDSQLARALAELGGLTRQLGYGSDVVVACCDAAVRDVRNVFSVEHVELYGGGGTDMGVGLRAFIDRKHDPIDVLVIVSDCHTQWPEDVPPFPVITIRVGDGTPPPWGNRGTNRVITLAEPGAAPNGSDRQRRSG